MASYVLRKFKQQIIDNLPPPGKAYPISPSPNSLWKRGLGKKKKKQRIEFTILMHTAGELKNVGKRAPKRPIEGEQLTWGRISKK